MLKRKKGFTLIELLVVVAIIGILASVVLASLNTARTKGKDASAEASISSMRAQAELGVNSSGKYLPALCTAVGTGSIASLITAVTAVGATATKCATSDIDANPSGAWAFEALLPSGGTNFFCVDSTGFAGPQGASTIAANVNAVTASVDYTCG